MASELGEELAGRGHDVHFISYERPFRVPADRLDQIGAAVEAAFGSAGFLPPGLIPAYAAGGAARDR